MGQQTSLSKLVYRPPGKRDKAITITMEKSRLEKTNNQGTINSTLLTSLANRQLPKNTVNERNNILKEGLPLSYSTTNVIYREAAHDRDPAQRQALSRLIPGLESEEMSISLIFIKSHETPRHARN